jgi:hypothetical protein
MCTVDLGWLIRRLEESGLWWARFAPRQPSAVGQVLGDARFILRLFYSFLSSFFLSFRVRLSFVSFAFPSFFLSFHGLIFLSQKFFFEFCKDVVDLSTFL